MNSGHTINRWCFHSFTFREYYGCHTHTGARLKISTSYLTGVGKISAPYKKATEKLLVMQNLPNIAGIISGMKKSVPSPAETK